MDQEFRNKVAEFKQMFPAMSDQEVFEAALRFFQVKAQQPYVPKQPGLQRLDQIQISVEINKIRHEREELKSKLQNQTSGIFSGILGRYFGVTPEQTSSEEREYVLRRLEELDRLEIALRRRQTLGE